jgi:hypothetical protein
VKNKVLLIGNGINNIKSEYKWEDLIDDLISLIGAGGQIAIKDKPFPLLYEEIFIEAVKNRGFTESRIKNEIANKVSKISSNVIHEKIMQMPFSNILTTNYDYTLEGIFVKDTSGIKNIGTVSETTYSIFRHSSVENKNIWHIHGESNVPLSITLGFEHYSGYLQRIRDYVVTGTSNNYQEKFAPLIERFKKRKIKYESWLDFFITKDVHIIGFTLDFAEFHLWWLLTYRARMKFAKQYSVGNKIVYYYPERYSDRIAGKIDLLRSVDVIPYSIKMKRDNWEKYYLDVLKKIETM